MNQNERQSYCSPAIMMLEMESLGILCGSNELLEENEGEW